MKKIRDIEERLRQSKVYLILILQRINTGSKENLFTEMTPEHFTLLKHKIFRSRNKANWRKSKKESTF